MAATSAKRFLQLLQKSGLVAPDALRPALDDLKRIAAGTIVDLDRLAGHLIEQGLITQWHCDKLAAGKYKGFFLGKYKLLGHLGTGGMSTVYLAEHTITGQRRAIKVLPRKKAADKSYLDRFYREGRAAAALNHPNIVRVYDIAGEATTHYMVIEYVEGTDLYRMVKKNGPVDFNMAVKYILQAAIGLQHAHERKLVHRDIKPANLLVSPNGSVKILDLGLALLKTDEEESLTDVHKERVMGTADYLAPEQGVNSHRVDQRADIYGLGCTLYYLLTGHPPFPDGSIAQRILAHQTKEPADVRVTRADCPNRLVQICAKMMRKKRSERFQDCGELMMALDSYRAPNQYSDAEFESLLATPKPGISTETNRIKPIVDEAIQSDSDRREAPVAKNRPAGKSKKNHLQRPPQQKRKKRVLIGMILSIASLLLLTGALGFVVVSKYFGASNQPVASTSKSKLQNQTRRPASLASNRHGTGKFATSNRRTSTIPQKTPVFTDNANDTSVRPDKSLTLIKFEADEGFSDRLKDWPIYANEFKTGTLRCRESCKLYRDSDYSKSCLLIFGNTKNVEFRPNDQTKQLREIKFLARRQTTDESFSFELQVKSARPEHNFQKWQTVFAYDSNSPNMSSTSYTNIKVDDKELELIHPIAQKFRFKLGGQRQNGILIDDLSIMLER